MKAAILPNKDRDSNLEYTKKLAFALSEKGIEAAMDVSFEDDGINACFYDGADLYKGADALIVLGGDGSILHAIEEATEYSLPIFAVNLGRIGYIAQFEKSDFEKIADMIKNGFETTEKELISVSLERAGKTEIDGLLALNDAVITKNIRGGVVETEMIVDGRSVITYRGDGVIAATPTGSTAYSMSAGGPILDPMLKAVCVTPICAHSLKSRPIVVSEHSSLAFRCLSEDMKMALCIDGRTDIMLEYMDIVRVSISEKKVKFAVNANSGFCKLLYDKMTDV